MSTSSVPLWESAPPYPRRIVCMTEETTEILYRIGAGDRVVGISGYTVRPPEARRKPKISSFLQADYEQILQLEPDLVLGFSDLQAELAAELARRGVPVYLFNQRSVAEILQTVRIVGALVGMSQSAEALADELEAHLVRTAKQVEQARKQAEQTAATATTDARRPRVFFEEWHEPLISGIRWVSELIEIAGGEDLCRESRERHDAAGRIYSPEEIAGRDPELVIASWCGRKAKVDKIRERPGWARVTAVRQDQLYEIKSAYILQPGPAALTDGLDQIARIVAAVREGRQLAAPKVGELRRADL